jgi:multiple sugar transport system substrate-binding protein
MIDPARTLSRRSFLKAAALTGGAAGLGALGLSACGSSPGTQKKTIEYWGYIVASDKVATAAEAKWIAMFPAAEKNVEVHRVYVPSDQMTAKIIGSGAGKKGPDAFQQSGDLDQLVPAGVLTDLTAYFNSWADKDKINLAALGKRDGKIYSVKPYSNLVALWYNKDILDKYSITPPKTIDDLGAALKRIGKSPHVGLAIAGDANIDADFQARAFYSGFGFDYLKPEVAPLEETFALFADWLHAGYLPPDISTWSQATSFPRFTAGNIAFCVNGNWQAAAAKQQAKFAYGVVPMPTGPKGGTVYLGGEEFCVGKYADDKDLAWKFLTSTFLSQQGGAIANSLGSISNRTDLANDPAATDPVAAAFKEATKAGTEYPDPGLGRKVNAVRQVFGQGWNAVLAGQKSPHDAAQSVVDSLNKLLG